MPDFLEDTHDLADLAALARVLPEDVPENLHSAALAYLTSAEWVSVPVSGVFRGELRSAAGTDASDFVSGEIDSF